jgi:hypothetical protein
MKALAGACIVLVALSMSAVSTSAQDRPPQGQGSIFVDDLGGLQFNWTDFDNDTLTVFWPISGPADFARETPNGKRYVHAMSEDVAMSAVVGGVTYNGRGTYQTSYFANCDVFDPAAPAFHCRIGPGPASMNADGQVTNSITGQQCTLSAHMALFFLQQKACDAVTGGDPGCINGALFGGNERQFDIKVTCGS